MKVTVAIELAKQGTLHIQSESQDTLEKCLKEIMPDVEIVMVKNDHRQGEQLKALKTLFTKS